LATALKQFSVALAGKGVLTAAGLGLSPLQRAVAANTGNLQRRDCLIGKTLQSVIGGFVADEITAQLRAADPANRASRPFLFAAAAAEQAVADSGRILGAIPAARRGFVLSTTKANIDVFDQLAAGQPVPLAAQRQIQPAFLATDLAVRFDCRGPLQCVSAACVSGLLALQQGAACIRRGRADAVLVVGVDVISNFVLSGFNTLKSLDPEGCRPFDLGRVGLSLGEGAAAIVLVRRELAPAPRLLLTGCGTSNDANHLTGPSRDGAGLALAIRRALAASCAAPEDIDYLNAHGTGTPYNDNMEALAFRTVFGDHIPPFSGTKGITGHTLGGAGVIETTLCAATLESRLLPGTPRLRERDPVAPESLLETARPAAKLKRILKVNCGFGGTNAALIIEREQP